MSCLGKGSARAFWAFENGLGGRLFCGGDETEKALDETLAARAVRRFRLRERVTRPYQEVVAKGMSGSRIFAFADLFRRSFLQTRARFFGIAGLLFALYTLAGFVLQQYFSFAYSRSSVGDLIFGAVLLLSSLLLLFVGKPIGEVLSESRVFGRICIGVLGIDPGSLRVHEQDGDKGGATSSHGALAFFLGTALGVAGIFLYPHRVAVWTLQLIILLVVLAVPESGLLGAVLLLPFVPLSVTAAWACAALFSYLLKVLRLKRTFRLRVPEAMMLLTVLSVFLASRSGLPAGDEAGRTFAVYLLFGVLWVLTVNLIKTGTLYRKFIACIMYGGIITLTVTAARFLLIAFRLNEWLRWIPGETLNTEVLDIFLVVLVPLVLLHGKRWSGLTALVLVAVNAYFVQSMWVWLGILVSVLLYLMLAKRAFFESVAVGCITVPMFLIAFGNDFSTLSVRMSGSARALLGEYWLCGIGVGEGIARLGAAANGLVTDGFSAHLYARLLLEGGLIHLILFLLAALFALQYVFTAMRNAQSKNAKTLCGGVAAALILFLACGFALDIQADIRMIGLLWCICPAASMAKELYGRTAEESR
ncbi:MAG: hypothetical protein J5843_04195 [Clostridia bacterium]|nr:hypothetical protein [Clostridia bacterium]